MKRKRFLVGLLIPIFGALAVVGSGFSVFIFDENNSVTIDGNITVENAVTGASIEVKHTSIGLVFDQTASANNAEGKGVYLKFTKKTSVDDADEGKVVFDYGSSTSNKNYKVQLKLKNELAAYISFAIGSTGYALTESSDATDKTYTFVKENQTSTSTFNWKDVTLNYAISQEPANKGQWDTLNGIEKTNALSVTYSFS